MNTLIITAVVCLLLAAMQCAAAAPTINGTFCGTTNNNVLNLRFDFFGPGPTGNATFQMIDFGVERFQRCNEVFSIDESSSEIQFPLFVSDPNDCMANQLQLMWITDFTMTPLVVVDAKVQQLNMQVGAFALVLNRC